MGCVDAHLMWEHVCVTGVVCFRVWQVPGHMPVCGPVWVIWSMLCRPQGGISPMGTDSFLLCQVSVVPLCFPAWETADPTLWTERGIQVAEKEN